MHSLKLVVVFIVTGIILMACGVQPEEEVIEFEATSTSVPVGYPGNPVQSNSDWEPVIEEFDGVTMALVPVGCFMMGSESGRDNEKPSHEQCFDEPFFIDIYEVTNSLYGKEASDYDQEKPVTFVNWYEANEYCENRDGRLPTEAEWEYAARGPDNLFYTWRTGRLSELYINMDSEGRFTGPFLVGSWPKGASWVGALDMIGNVAEWTSTIFKDYPYDPSHDTAVSDIVDENESLVVRGNAYSNRPEDNFQASYRAVSKPTKENNSLGFRCVRPR